MKRSNSRADTCWLTTLQSLHRKTSGAGTTIFRGELNFLCKGREQSGTGQSQRTPKHHARCIPEMGGDGRRRTSLFGTSFKLKLGRRLKGGMWKIGNLPISRRFPVRARKKRRRKCPPWGLTPMRTGIVLACNFQALHFGLQGRALQAEATGSPVRSGEHASGFAEHRMCSRSALSRL